MKTKKYKDSIQSKITRLMWIVFSQLIWIIPVLYLAYYVKENLSDWVNLYFGVEVAQKTAEALAVRAEILSEPVIMNPSTITAYVKAAFASMSATTKAFSLSSIAGITTSLGTILINIISFIVIIYGLLRIRKTYQLQTHDTALVHHICDEIMPELEAIKKEILLLRQNKDCDKTDIRRNY